MHLCIGVKIAQNYIRLCLKMGGLYGKHGLAWYDFFGYPIVHIALNYSISTNGTNGNCLLNKKLNVCIGSYKFNSKHMLLKF